MHHLRHPYTQESPSQRQGGPGGGHPLPGCAAPLTLTVDVKVEPGAVVVLVWRSVEEHHLALIPALVRLADVSEVERCLAIAGLWTDPRYTTLVLVGRVRRVVLIPDVHRNILPLPQIRHPATLCARNSNTVHSIWTQGIAVIRNFDSAESNRQCNRAIFKITALSKVVNHYAQIIKTDTCRQSYH